MPVSGHSATYRDALMSQRSRLAFPVRGSQFRPPLRYLGHSSSSKHISNPIPTQVYRGRRVDGPTNVKRSCWYGNRCWRGSACPVAHPHRAWRLKHMVVKPQSKNGRLQQDASSPQEGTLFPSIDRRAEALVQKHGSQFRHQFRRKKQTTCTQRQAHNVARTHNFRNPLVNPRPPQSWNS